MVKFKLLKRNETDTVFCDYCQLKSQPKEQTITLYNCKSKSFLVGNMPSDYSVKVGTIPLVVSELVAIYQITTPPWYYRREEDAGSLANMERLSLDVGVMDLFAEMTGV